MWGAAIYARSLAFGYTYMDDYGLIVENIRFIGRIGNLPAAFRCDAFGLSTGSFYRPLLTVSLMLDAWWVGVRPLAYHLTNIMIHLACSALLFHIILSLGHRRLAALLATAWFVAHPALSQAVAWIPGRNDSLLALWALLSFSFLIRYCRGFRIQWGLASLLAWGLALFTKETALVFPAVATLYILLDTGPDRTKAFRLLMPGWIVLAALFLFARHQVAGGINAANAEPLFLNSFGENINGLLSYIAKAVLPFRLAVFAGYDHLNYWLGAAALILIITLFVLGGIANKRRFLFGAAWFLVFLLPYAVRGVDYANFLEHRLYLPFVGLVILSLESPPLRALNKRTVRFAILAVVAVFGIITMTRIGVDADGLTFWRSAARTSPGLYNVHDMLGKVYMGQRDFPAARQEFERALALNPGFAFSHNNLGMIYLLTGKEQEARSEFKRALALKPDYSEARFNLGSDYLMRDRLDSAAAQFDTILTYDPGHAGAVNQLGLISKKRGDGSRAEGLFARAVELDSTNAVYWFNLGSSYLETGRAALARPALETASRLDTANARYHRELGVADLQLRRPDLAEPQLLAAWQSNPDDPALNNYLALVYFALRRYDRASYHYDRAMANGLAPDPRIVKLLAPYRHSN